MFSIIASIGKNYELGINNKLIWNIPDDMKFFKNTTLNHKVVMGRKTFESIGKILPKRENFIVTTKVTNTPNAHIVTDLEKFILYNNDTNEEIFIIGGSSIYRQFFSYATKIYLTEIEESCVEADSFFPEFDKSKYLKNTLFKGNNEKIKYSCNIYIKK